MKNTIALVILSLMFYTVSESHAVKFDWAKVGNPGNADDIHDDGYGGVDYYYRISKHEVTNAQYTEFLNAVAASDPNGLYNTSMGITRSEFDGSYTYSVRPDTIGEGPGGADGDDYAYANKPVVHISFFDAMRFVNWLENGQPTGAQGPGTTEDGVYTISDGVSEFRNPGTKYRIPSADESYKAAYYDPGGVYYDYATSTDTTPNNNLPSADTGNSANFLGSSGPTTGKTSYPLTDVGAYALSQSPYGTFDQAGNAMEWSDTVAFISFFGVFGRAQIGDGWNTGAVQAGLHGIGFPGGESSATGFRVAVPEPSSLVLLAIGSLALLRRRRLALTTMPIHNRSD